jgi:hypothetical protein
MKLYRNTNGQWFGTQADAKAAGADWQMVNVPTDKPNLLQWLNMGAPFEHDLCDAEHQQDQPMRWQIERDADGGAHMTPAKQSNITKPHAWQTIRECAEKADLKDLGVALAVLMNRLDEAADNVRH